MPPVCAPEQGLSCRPAGCLSHWRGPRLAEAASPLHAGTQALGIFTLGFLSPLSVFRKAGGQGRKTWDHSGFCRSPEVSRKGHMSLRRCNVSPSTQQSICPSGYAGSTPLVHGPWPRLGVSCVNQPHSSKTTEWFCLELRQDRWASVPPKPRR